LGGGRRIGISIAGGRIFVPPALDVERIEFIVNRAEEIAAPQHGFQGV
jgi:hypothetical protein